MARNDPITQAEDWFTGEDKTFLWTIYTDDVGSTPQDITGYTFIWELRKFRDSETVVLTKSNGSGITISSPAGGQLTVTVAHLDTVNLDPGTYYHELVRNGSGVETVETYGDAILQRGQR